MAEEQSKDHWDHRDLAVVLLLLALAAGLRFWDLGDPAGSVFDERFYVRESCERYIETSPDCREIVAQPLPTGGSKEAQEVLKRVFGFLVSDYFNVHPPLGQRTIGWSHQLFGVDAQGWRTLPAVAGTVAVALMYLAARLTLRNRIAPALAALLLAVEPMHLVYSRVAMLDIFLGTFVLAATVFLLLERRRMLENSDPRRSRWQRVRWRVGLGLACGAAIATKWPAVYFVAGAAWLLLVWEVKSRKEGPSLPAALRVAAPNILLYLGMIPAAIYLTSYVGWVDGRLLAFPWDEGSWLNAVWDHQTRMLNFHSNLSIPHPNSSPPWTWLLLKRPMTAHMELPGVTYHKDILAVSNPLLTWVSIPVLVALLGWWVKARREKQVMSVVLMGVTTTYLVWLLTSLVFPAREALYIYYLLPTMPFLILAVVWALTRIKPAALRNAAFAGYALLGVAFTGFMFPVLTGQQIAAEAWHQRVLFESCDPQDVELVILPVPGQPGVPVDLPALLPPKGWCWR